MRCETALVTHDLADAAGVGAFGFPANSAVQYCMRAGPAGRSARPVAAAKTAELCYVRWVAL